MLQCDSRAQSSKYFTRTSLSAYLGTSQAVDRISSYLHAHLLLKNIMISEVYSLRNLLEVGNVNLAYINCLAGGRFGRTREQASTFQSGLDGEKQTIC